MGIKIRQKIEKTLKNSHKNRVYNKKTIEPKDNPDTEEINSQVEAFEEEDYEFYDEED
jgi:hypothetical protein